MLKTGWTWDQYMETPQEIISKMTIIINAEAEVTRMRSQEVERKTRR